MTVLVIGGGITGLVAARDLALAGVPVMLVEAQPRLGGKIATERIDGFVVESGPDSFLAARPAGVALCHELGLEDRLVSPTEPRAVYIRHGGRLVPLPDGLGLVLPTRLGPFLASPLFSPREKLRMGLDLVLPRSRHDGDESVGAFLRRRVGGAPVERLAGPLVGGIYGTDIDELSLLAVMPQLHEAERNHRSLLLAGLAAGRAHRRRGVADLNGTVAHGQDGRPGGPRGASQGSAPLEDRQRRRPAALFVSLAGGMDELIDALRTALERAPEPVDVRAGTSVEALERAAGAHLVRLSDRTTVRAEAIILATPASVAARLLESTLPAAARELATIPFGSTVAVSLGFREGQLPGPLRGHGFLVPPDEVLAISACTWSSSKWLGRAPQGFVLLRAFPKDPEAALLAATDVPLVASVRTELARSMGIRGEPVLAHVVRWPQAMPRYTVGHLDRVRAAETALTATPGIVLASGSYRGVGLPDCVTQGRTAASRVLGWLGGRPGKQASAGRAAGFASSGQPGSP